MSNDNSPLSQLFGLMPDIKRPEWREFDGLSVRERVILSNEQDMNYFNNKLELAISPKTKARILKHIILLSYANIIKKHCV